MLFLPSGRVSCPFRANGTEIGGVALTLLNPVSDTGKEIGFEAGIARFDQDLNYRCLGDVLRGWVRFF